MNVPVIKESAEAVWHLLNGDNRKWEYKDIKAATGLSDRNLNAAIGWLACKGVIQFSEEDGDTSDSMYIELSLYIG